MSHAASIEGLLGAAAWQRLPAAVRARFPDPAVAVDYVGEFEVVRASPLGRLIAGFCLLLGTPVVPRTGEHVPAVVRVGPTERGVAWNREYRWPGSSACLVRSTKVIGPDGGLVEELPARLCMPLDVFERCGVLHFVSRGYYFRLGSFHLWLPHWLSPGTTHVEHEDEGAGWFRFTMTVRHALFGELFYQTGRFSAAEAVPCSQSSR
ncbi:MAG: DUF4166 domain-containing protein [Proteobacteria bacterium]|nr:DUF4166 domain-containing protein [Pseudomonadota bacterium]